MTNGSWTTLRMFILPQSASWLANIGSTATFFNFHLIPLSACCNLIMLKIGTATLCTVPHYLILIAALTNFPGWMTQVNHNTMREKTSFPNYNCNMNCLLCVYFNISIYLYFVITKPVASSGYTTTDIIVSDPQLQNSYWRCCRSTRYIHQLSLNYTYIHTFKQYHIIVR